MKNIEVTFTQTQEHQKVGTHKPTSFDELKKKSNRLVSLYGGIFIVYLLDGSKLQMNRREFNKWAKNNKYVCDF